jgi:hypothetical protein
LLLCNLCVWVCLDDFSIEFICPMSCFDHKRLVRIHYRLYLVIKRFLISIWSCFYIPSVFLISKMCLYRIHVYFFIS